MGIFLVSLVTTSHLLQLEMANSSTTMSKHVKTIPQC